jgi:GNAT superfamily N-acetyltransferase
MAVLPSHRGQRVGEQMLALVDEIARGLCRLPTGPRHGAGAVFSEMAGLNACHESAI